jgi:hypothetical protein
MKKVYILSAFQAATSLALIAQSSGGPTVSIVSADGSYIEGVGLCPNVSIVNPDSDTTKVTLAIAVTSTATEGPDFVLGQTQVVFPPNFSGNMNFCVITADDLDYEGIESIEIRLRYPTNGASIADSMINFYIWDNDSITTTSPCADLFISEYIHSIGTGSQVLEIFNPTNLPVDLSDYAISLYYNGSATAGNTVTLSGTLLPDSVFILANPTADPAVLAVADLLSTSVNFTGDDAVALYHGVNLIDIIGIIGNDPGNSWPAASGGSSTSASDLVRRQQVFQGETSWLISAGNWNYFSPGTTANLGSHTMLPCGFSGPTVSVLTSDASFVEGIGFGFTVVLADPNSDTTFVDVIVEASSSATNGVDFTYGPTTLAFPPGSSSQGVGVNLTDDSVVEPREEFTLRLTNPQNPAGVLMGDSLFTCQIYDNDTVITNFVCQDLFFSEYLHNVPDDTRALEIFNPTPNAISLSGYDIRIYQDGNTTPDSVIGLTGSVAAGDVFILSNVGAHSTVAAVSDQASASLWFYQRSVIELVRPGNLVIDVIGKKGEDPVNGWTAGSGGSTGSNDLVRMPFVQQGQPWVVGAAHWFVFAQTDFSHLDFHVMDSCVIPPPMMGVITADTDAPEDTSTVTVSVGLANPPSGGITVDVVVDPGSTATDGADVTYSPTTLSFPGGIPSVQQVTVTISDDALFEGDETFTLRLTNPSVPNVVFADSVWTLTILDNDPVGATNPDNPGVTVQPNPARDAVRIGLTSPSPWDLSILDLTGKLIVEMSGITGSHLHVPLAGLPAGVYVLRAVNGAEQHLRKFVKE